MSKTTKIILLLAIPFLLASIFIVPGLFERNSSPGDAQAQQDESPQAERDSRLAVRVYIAEVSEFSNNIFTTGTVLADEEVTLRPEVSGRVTGIYFEEGEFVEKGDLLLKINDSDLVAELRRAEYRKNLAEIREQRMASLIERNATAQEEYDTALNELNVIKAEIDLIKAQIEKTEIKAPFDGVIGLKSISAGSYITPSTDIAVFQSLNPIKVDFSIPERYSGSVSRGQQFEFKRQGSQSTYEGNIYALEPRIETETRTLALRGRAPNDEHRILPGMFVEVTFNLDTMSDALMIPSEAVIPELDGQRIFVYEDGKAVSRQIQTGTRTDRRVLVVDGVSPGDTVITTGMLQLRNEMPVRIAEVRSSLNN